MSNKKKFYEITNSKEGTFLAKAFGEVVFEQRCDELIQCDCALIARNGKNYSIYVPRQTWLKTWDTNKGLFCIFNNVKEFQCYESTDLSIGGLLLIKEEHLIPIVLNTFTTDLDITKLEDRKKTVSKIECVDSSKVSIEIGIRDFQTIAFVINVDGRYYHISSENERNPNAIVKVKEFEKLEAIVDKKNIKVIENNTEAFMSANGSISFGPFRKIQKMKEYPPINAEYCAYFAIDTNGKIVAIKVTTNNCLCNYRYHYTIELNKPAEKIEFIKRIDITKKNIGRSIIIGDGFDPNLPSNAVEVWKVFYEDGEELVIQTIGSVGSIFQFTIDL